MDVGADVGEEVGAVAGLGDGGGEAGEFAAVVGEDFAVAGEVVLFQGGGGEGCFGVEEAGELGDEGGALFRSALDWSGVGEGGRTFSRRSFSCDSRRSSSSDGVGGSLVMEAYWA